jgi:hypothetical protein
MGAGARKSDRPARLDASHSLDVVRRYKFGRYSNLPGVRNLGNHKNDCLLYRDGDFDSVAHGTACDALNRAAEIVNEGLCTLRVDECVGQVRFSYRGAWVA